MNRIVVPLVLVAACSKSADKKPAPPPDPKPAAAPAAGSNDPQLVAFCARSYFKIMDCFKDDQFWQTLSTMYFANNNLTSSDADRDHWIGVMKEDILKLYNEHGFEQNCQASLEHNRAPSEKDVKTVTAALGSSCPAFASAFGYMVFSEGVLNQPK